MTETTTGKTRQRQSQEPRQLRLIRHIINTVGKASPSLAGWLAVQAFFTPMMQPGATRGQAMLDQADIVEIPHRGKYLRGYTWGHGDKTVLLVHGWRASSGSMSAFIIPLIAERFRVVAFDIPAHRHSPGWQTDLLDTSRAIKTAIRQFAPVHGVIAHSFGAMAAAITLADLQPREVARVALISTSHDLSRTIEGFAHQFGISKPVIQAFYKHFERRFGYPVEEFSIERTVPLIPADGMIVHDHGDPLVPFESAERLIATWSEVEGHRPAHHFTDGLGHNDLLRDEQTVKRIVSFISVR